MTMMISQPQGFFKLQTQVKKPVKMALVEITPANLDLMFRRTLNLLTMASNLKLMERKVPRLLVLKKEFSTLQQVRTTSSRAAK